MMAANQDDETNKLNEPEAAYAQRSLTKSDGADFSEELLQHYWPLLSDNQKAVIVDTAQGFAAANKPSVLSDAQLEELNQQREAIANGTMKTHTWDEVKSRIIQKYGPRKV